MKSVSNYFRFNCTIRGKSILFKLTAVIVLKNNKIFTGLTFFNIDYLTVNSFKTKMIFICILLMQTFLFSIL